MHHLTRPDRPALAYHHRTGTGPTILFLPGYMSDMAGSKALALDAWAAAHDRALLRFDYGGCGISEGAFEAQTLTDWRDDALALLDRVITGPVLLVGSSMGGWLMLLVALARPDRVAGLVGIAAAPDFTDWGYDADARAVLARDGRIVEPSAYDDHGTVLTRAFHASGQAALLLDTAIAIDCPVRLLHGQADADVPFPIALRLAAALRSADVQTLLVKDGDHRLSRPQDLDLLIATVARLLDMP